MSVYIRGMEMPTERESFQVTIKYNGVVLDTETGIQVAEAFSVPDHGRLIDADFIVKRLRKQIRDVGADTELANRDREFISVIGAVSTIIPADKEDGE